jgi:FkbM family methyltransferase
MLFLKRTVTALKAVQTYENWITFLQSHFKKLKGVKEVIIKLRNGIKYKIRANTHDAGVITEIWIHQYYTKPPAFEINENDTIIDIGAHIGVFSIFAAHKAKNGKIYTFEPMKENFELIKKNLELNKIKNVKAFNNAVSGQTEQKLFFINKRNTGGHSFYEGEGQSKKVIVEAISLEDIIKNNKIKKVDFLKMDCEGAEYDILFRSSDEVLEKLNKISMEVHDIDEKLNIESMKKFLEKKNFKIVKTPNMGDPNLSMLYAQRYYSN